ncbi:FecR domain-containing protein [Reinekea sp. G2M2-21]|uniref:FecR family protein n=1 Tax=Reinekea sp. G2M2-21 TaxID=2788942 RepID=UPI0018A99FB1|nr:FecR family protein [Reinekea sp. G2M2-21]
MKTRLWHVFILVLLTGLGVDMAYASIGKVIIAKGETYALDSANNPRPLQRRSDVLEGDTLVTGADSEIHIRFKDNAVLALRADSQLKISEYQNAEDGNQERVLMELLSGGFRTITGSFGKSNKDAYQIKTPNASIGIRGTNYEAILTQDNLIVGVYQGGVRLQNQAGSFNLGIDSAFSFAQVAGQNAAIQGLLEAPAELSQPLATSFNAPPATNEADDSEATATLKDEDNGLLVEAIFDDKPARQSDTDTPDVRPLGSQLSGISEPDPVQQTVTQISTTTDLSAFQDVRLTQEQIRALENGAPVGFVVVNEDPTGYRLPEYTASFGYAGGSFTSTGSLTFDLVLKTDSGDITYTIDLSNLSASNIISEISTQISTIAGDIDGKAILPRLKVDLIGGKLVVKGIIDGSGAEVIFANFQGNDAIALAEALGLCNSSSIACNGTYNLGAPSVANYNSAVHFGYMVKGEDGPVFVNFDNESLNVLATGYKTPDNVFRGNPNATLTEFTSADTSSDGSNMVKWGYWNTSTVNPALLLKDPKELSLAETVTAPYYFISAPPAKAADMVGLKTMTTIVDWHATSSTTAGMQDYSATDPGCNNTALTCLSSTLAVDFGSAEATGTLALSNVDQDWAWQVDYYGTIKGAQFFSDYGYGTLTTANNTHDAVGHVDGLFTGGNTSLGFVGGFGLQTTDDQHQAQGVFVIK